MKNMIFPVITERELALPYCVLGVGCRYFQEHIVRMQGYPNFQWIQCYHGMGELKIGGMTYMVKENQGMLLYPQVPHEYYAVTPTWEVDWVTLGGTQVWDFILKTLDIPQSSVLYVSKPEIILAKIRKILMIELSDSPVKSLESSSVLYDILIDIMKYTSMEDDNSIQHRYNRLKPLFDYIEENSSRPLTLIELAEVVGITPQYLCTVFKKMMNLRISEYVNFVRIKKSKELLLRSREVQVKEVALLSGFEDVSYFCALFKKLEKISPGEFKKLHGF